MDFILTALRAVWKSGLRQVEWVLKDDDMTVWIMHNIDGVRIADEKVMIKINNRMMYLMRRGFATPTWIVTRIIPTSN